MPLHGVLIILDCLYRIFMWKSRQHINSAKRECDFINERYAYGGNVWGVILVIAPHMDDEMLACGATLAALPDKQSVHIIYATDGARSPVPNLPWETQDNPALVAVRMTEAERALAALGIPAIVTVHGFMWLNYKEIFF
jgi:hypothetical protein